METLTRRVAFFETVSIHQFIVESEHVIESVPDVPVVLPWQNNRRLGNQENVQAFLRTAIAESVHVDIHVGVDNGFSGIDERDVSALYYGDEVVPQMTVHKIDRNLIYGSCCPFRFR